MTETEIPYMALDITNLEMKFDEDGKTEIKIWGKCRTEEDIEDLVNWLHLAKATMRKWRSIRQKVSLSVTKPNDDGS